MTHLSAPAGTPAIGAPHNMPDVIDALKRLERIGSENSKTTEKLIAAAKELGDRIVEMCGLARDESITTERWQVWRQRGRKTS